MNMTELKQRRIQSHDRALNIFKAARAAQRKLMAKGASYAAINAAIDNTDTTLDNLVRAERNAYNAGAIAADLAA